MGINLHEKCPLTVGAAKEEHWLMWAAHTALIQRLDLARRNEMQEVYSKIDKFYGRGVNALELLLQSTPRMLKNLQCPAQDFHFAMLETAHSTRTLLPGVDECQDDIHRICK